AHGGYGCTAPDRNPARRRRRAHLSLFATARSVVPFSAHALSRMSKLTYRVLTLALTLVAAAPALAQEEPSTRAEALYQQRAEKEARVEPYRQNAVEKAFDFVEDHAIFLLNREGLYPKLGSLTTGSGFAYGVGWRNSRLFDHNLTVDSWVAGSIKGYFGLELRAALPRLADGHVFAEGYFRRRDYPHEDFF